MKITKTQLKEHIRKVIREQMSKDDAYWREEDLRDPDLEKERFNDKWAAIADEEDAWETKHSSKGKKVDEQIEFGDEYEDPESAFDDDLSMDYNDFSDDAMDPYADLGEEDDFYAEDEDDDYDHEPYLYGDDADELGVPESQGMSDDDLEEWDSAGRPLR